MADTFKEREQGYEAKFKLDEELQFKAQSRRNKLLGLWAAGKLGKTGDDADAYAREVISADLEEPGVDDVVRKVLSDFHGGGVTVSEDDLRAEIVKFDAIAIDQIQNDT